MFTNLEKMKEIGDDAAAVAVVYSSGYVGSGHRLNRWVASRGWYFVLLVQAVFLHYPSQDIFSLTLLSATLFPVPSYIPPKCPRVTLFASRHCPFLHSSPAPSSFSGDHYTPYQERYFPTVNRTRHVTLSPPLDLAERWNYTKPIQWILRRKRSKEGF